MLWRRLAVGVLTAMVAFVDLCGAAPPEPNIAGPERPGEGIFCAAAIYSVVAQVGRQCFADKNPEIQVELDASVAKLDAYILRNSATTPAELAEFKRKQGGVGASKEQLCRGDSVELYAAVARNGASRLRSGIDQMVSRPGKPTWGTCL